MTVKQYKRSFGFMIAVYIVIQLYTSGMFDRKSYNRRVLATSFTVPPEPAIKTASNCRPGARPDRLMYRPSSTVATKESTVIKETAPKRFITPKYEPSSAQDPKSSIKILRGGYRSTPGFLTIGLSSVPRVGASYLVDTLESLFSRLTDKQKGEVVVVLYLGSQDEMWINSTLSDLDQRFEKEIKNTLLQVIQPENHIYPNFSDITKRNFGDELDRVRWRTKQNVDFAHLFYHCRNISKFYIQIEDDVLVASDFLNDIKKFVGRLEAKNVSWFAIEFSSLGFIGKMFHSRHLSIIKDYLLMFKDEQPCDLLITHLKRVMVQPKDIRSPVSLFQHIGKISSLENKTQNLTDRLFKDRKRIGGIFRAHEWNKKNEYSQKIENYRKYPKSFTKENPEAKITTTLDMYKDYKAENAYLIDSSFFWGKDPKSGDYIEIKLDKLTYITAIVIKTGHPRLHTDTLQNGTIRLAHDLNGDNDCNVEDDLTKDFFVNFDITFKKPRPIKCVVILVKEDQKTWLVVSEIELRTGK